MAIRIRVYPQNGMYGAMGMGGMYGAAGYGGAVSAQTYYQDKLNTQKQVSSLQLSYERALFDQKLQNVQLSERLKNPYAYAGAGMAGGYPGAYGLGVGGLGMGGLGVGALGVNPYASMMTGSLLGGLSGANFFGSLGGII